MLDGGKMVTIISIIFIAFVPGLVWLLFFLREDCHPEPKKLIIFTFFIGVVFTFPALTLQVIFQSLALGFLPDALARFLFLILGLAFIEEIVKFWAAKFATHKKKDFDEPVDAMIYMITAALGFATAENIFVTSGILTATGFIAEAASVGLLRFVGATLLHVLASALVGYYWGKAEFLGKPKKLVGFGIIIGTGVHAIFNYLIIIFHDGRLIVPSLFLAFIAFFIFTNFERLKHKNNN